MKIYINKPFSNEQKIIENVKHIHFGLYDCLITFTNNEMKVINKNTIVEMEA